MQTKIARFLEKHSILPEDIKYIVREQGETVIYTIDGRTVSTYHPVKEFRESLSVEQFLCPNKGIIAAVSQVVGVKDGGYEMADGRVFKYRVHNSKLHDSRLLMLGRQMEQAEAEEERMGSFSVMDKLPLPVCVLELVMEEGSFSADFILRYSNQAALDFEHVQWAKVEGRLISELFPGIDAKWLTIFMDVALNDSIRGIVHYKKSLDMFMKVHCYQPMQGHCACVLTQIESKDAREAVRYVSELDLTKE